MKSYWIAATVILLTAWPLSTKAMTGSDQSKAEKPVQTAQSSNPQTSQPSATVQAQSITTNATGANAVVPASAAAAPSAAVSKPTNSYILVELSSSLKAKKLKPGDKIKAEVSQDVISHGKIIIPVETKLIGHVTEVRARDAENSESRLGIVFDRILLKHHDINFQGVVQAVSAPVIRRSRVDEPSQMMPPAIGSASRTSGGPSFGGAVGGRGNVPSQPPPSAGPASNGPIVTEIPSSQAQVEVKQSPMTNAAAGSSAAQLSIANSGHALSLGAPQGVTGIKGLGLSTSPSAETPGPVIVSASGNVKLESGTQILVHVLSVETPAK